MQQYRIREVDGLDEDVADTLTTMHDALFYKNAPPIDPSVGYWWLVHNWAGMRTPEAIAFAGLSITENGGYLCRSGVLRKHRGRKLQVRLVRAREAKARKLGLPYMFTDTTYNTASSNSLINAGYKLYKPEEPWGLKDSLYWRKEMK